MRFLADEPQTIDFAAIQTYIDREGCRLSIRSGAAVEKKNVLLYWSGGKDSAMALYDLATNPRFRDYQVTDVLTTLTEGYDRISGHGVRNVLLDRQAECLGLSLHRTYIPKQSSMSDYEYVIEGALRHYRDRGTRVAATGDIFIEKRRMAIFRRVGVAGCFPLMRVHAREHAMRIIDLGFKSYVVAVDSAALPETYAGRLFDRDFVESLPVGVDVCGENGEFHTFVFDGPLFKEPVRCRLGEVVYRESLFFCDVLPDDSWIGRNT
jgi:uncharacterized protein (TIGR00290 family)